MKKIFYSIAIAILALSACQKVEFNPQDSGLVDVLFDVKMPENNWGTKALAENPDLKTLHVALFDGNGYKVDCVEATLASINNEARTYTYSMRVTSTSDPRILHFLGNCPADKAAQIAETYGNEMTLLSDIVCDAEHDAYWQKITLQNGIPSDPGAAKTAIGSVELVRNYAKLTVISTAPLFQLDGIIVYNVPDKGFLAPYINSGSQAGKFVEDYQSKSYEQVTAVYPGYTPAGASLKAYDSQDELIPADDAHVASAFMFETPASSATPFIIVGGRFLGSNELGKADGAYCYYKVNLKDVNGKDYALLRNFNFKINIVGVTRKGEDSIAAAIESTGSGDISTLSTFENSTNISDTQSQLFISETAVTVVKQSTIQIKYKFIPDVKNNAATHNNNLRNGETDSTKPIEIELGEAGEFGAAIASYSVANSDDSADGYRVITINTTAQDGAFKQQKLTIKGHGQLADGTYGGNIVTRTVTISVRPSFKLTAECPLIVSGEAGESLPVTLGLESDIPETIFPVNIVVEAAAMTLVPASTENLPVTSGKSLSGSGKPAYQFVKNVSYAEYNFAKANAFQKDGVTYYPIVCNFVTNTDNSSSMVYAQSELFNSANCEFTLAKKYTEVAFSQALVGNNKDLTLSFKAEGTEPVTITLVGAIKDGSNVVTFIPSAAGATQIVTGLKTTSYGKAVSAILRNEYYTTANAQSYRSAVLKSNSLSSDNLPTAPANITSGSSKDFTMSVNGQNVTFKGARSSSVYSLTGPNADATIAFTQDVTADTVVPMSYTYNSKTATCNSMTVDQIVTGTVGEVVFTLQ